MRAYIFVPKWLEIIIGCINFVFRILERREVLKDDWS